MGIVSKLLKSKKVGNITDENCVITVKLSNGMFEYMADVIIKKNKLSYMNIAIDIYNRNLGKMRKEIFNPIKERGENGCDYLRTVIRFVNKQNKREHFDIPLPIFAEKNINRSLNKFKDHKWYKSNMKILKHIEKRINKK